MFGKMDVYLKFQIGDGEECKTKVHKSGGKTPKWQDEEIKLFKSSRDTMLKVVAWDEDRLSDDLIGQAEIEIAPFVGQIVRDRWISIYYKGKDVGQIKMHISFHQFLPCNEK